MIEKNSNLHKELLNVFDGDPVRITISTNETTDTLGGEGCITLVYKNKEKNPHNFEFIITGRIPTIGALMALEEIRKIINQGSDGR